MYCKQDKVAVCALCVYSGHKDHDLCILADERLHCMERVHAHLQLLGVLTHTITQSAIAVDKRHEEVTGNSITDVSKPARHGHKHGHGHGGSGKNSGEALLTTASHEAAAYFSTLRLELDQREAEVMQQLAEIGTTTASSLHAAYDSASMLVARSYAAAAHAKQCSTGQQSLASMLESEIQISANISALQKEIKETPVLSASSVNLFEFQTPGEAKFTEFIRKAKFVARSPLCLKTAKTEKTVKTVKTETYHPGEYV
jgi:hypothetical protein